MDKKLVFSKKNIWMGIISGVLAGIIFGFIMIKTGAFDEFAELLGRMNAFSVFLMHILYTAVLGVIFAIAFYQVGTDFFHCIMGGIVYGVIWWFLGNLTIAPLMMGYSVSWDYQTMLEAFPMLIGYLVFGLSLGIIYYCGRRGQDLSKSALVK